MATILIVKEWDIENPTDIHGFTTVEGACEFIKENYPDFAPEGWDRRDYGSDEESEAYRDYILDCCLFAVMCPDIFCRRTFVNYGDWGEDKLMITSLSVD